MFLDKMSSKCIRRYDQPLLADMDTLSNAQPKETLFSKGIPLMSNAVAMR
jgi:hypothetical protein